MSKRTSSIHRGHAMKLAKAVNQRATTKGDSLSDDEMMQAIEDCFSDDDSVELNGSFEDSLETADA